MRAGLRFKGMGMPLDDVARQLQVNCLVDESVRRTGDRVRVGAQLVNGRNGAVLGSGQFERALKDALALRRQMADLEPQGLLAHLQRAKQLRLARRPAQALGAVERALWVSRKSRSSLIEKSAVLLSPGRREEALALARPFDWVDVFMLAGNAEDTAALWGRSTQSEHRLAAPALRDGKVDACFDHFERNHAKLRDRSEALFDSVLDPVRQHPRFKAYLARRQPAAELCSG